MMTGTSGRRALALGKSSRPLIPGMLMSERIKINDAPAASAMRCSAAGADCANSIVNRLALRSRRNSWRNSTSTSGSSSTTLRLGIAIGGDHDDLDVRPLSLRLWQEFKPAHSWHIDVGE